MTRALIGACLAIAFLASGRPVRGGEPGGGGLSGSWGGEHVGLEAGESGARVEYDCAHGTISRPIVPDRRGRFDLPGTHTEERGGPVRQGEARAGRPARFVGRVTGNRMEFTVTLTDDGEAVGTFTLVRGQEPFLVRCR